MAAKKKGANKKKTAKSYTPVNRFLRFKITNDSNGDTERSFFLDIGEQLSKLNRRLYRQGKVYQIANISITSTNTPNGFVSFSTAPDTWVTRAAWNRGFKMYQAMNKKVLDLPGTNVRKGRWDDFKIFLSEDHLNALSTQNPDCIDNENVEVASGQWNATHFVSPDQTAGSDEFTAHLLGDHDGQVGSWSSISLIKSYGDSRPTVSDDTPMMDSNGHADPLFNLFDDGETVHEIAENLDQKGDDPPYSLMSGGNVATIGNQYPGSFGNMPNPIVNRMATIGTQGGVAAPTVMLPGFPVICGLLEIEAKSSLAADEFDIIIELAPGNYKGVAAFDI